MVLVSKFSSPPPFFLNLFFPALPWMGGISAAPYGGYATPALAQQPDALIHVLRALGGDHVLTHYQPKQYLKLWIRQVLPVDRYSLITRRDCTEKDTLAYIRNSSYSLPYYMNLQEDSVYSSMS